MLRGNEAPESARQHCPSRGSSARSRLPGCPTPRVCDRRWRCGTPHADILKPPNPTAPPWSAPPGSSRAAHCPAGVYTRCHIQSNSGCIYENADVQEVLSDPESLQVPGLCATWWPSDLTAPKKRPVHHVVLHAHAPQGNPLQHACHARPALSA